MYIDSLFIWRLHSIKYMMHSTVITTTVSFLFLLCLSFCLFPLTFLVLLLSFFLSTFSVFSFYVSFAYLWCCSFIKLLTWYTPMLLLLTDYFLFLNVLLLVVVVVIVLFSPSPPLSLSLSWFLFVWLNQQVLPFLSGQHLFRGSNIVSYLYSLVRDFNFQNWTFFLSFWLCHASISKDYSSISLNLLGFIFSRPRLWYALTG